MQPAQRALNMPLSMRWDPPGPVAAAFEASDALQALIIGPVGSGKTTTAARKATVLARRMPSLPETVNGRVIRVKYARIAVVAATYRVMWRNLLPSYWKVFPKEWGGKSGWKGGSGEPWEHRFRLDAGDDLVIDLQFSGLAVGDASLDDLTRGLEISAAWIYEFDTMPEETISKFFSRCGRYPKMPTGEEQDTVPRQVWGDANSFDPDHWAYAECFDEPPEGRQVFLQPGGRTAKAENVQNVGRRYYDDQVRVLKPWEIARKVDNKFVPDRPGFVVFNDWDPTVHEAAHELAPEKTLPLLVGVDPGLKFAAEICQRPGPKIWRVFDEVVTPKDQAWTAQVAAEKLTDKLAQEFPAFPVLAILDPAALQRSSATAGPVAQAWFAEFVKHFPYPVRIAYSNKVKGTDGRHEAVRKCLTRLEGGAPGLLVNQACKVLRKGFNGGYRWKPKANDKGVASDEIEDAYETHAQDGLQYVVHTIEALPDLMLQAAGGARTIGGETGGAMDIVF